MSDDTSSNTPAEVQGDYYVTNFHTLVGYVHRLYADLLSAEEKQWYARICDLPAEAQRLYIRLLTRKGSIFRLGKLNYADVGKLDLAAFALEDSQLASCIPPAELSALVPAFTKPELLKLLKLEACRHLSRPALVAHIEGAENDDRSRFVCTLQKSEHWITLGGYSHWMLMQLCFFGNLYQDSSEFIVSQLGNLRYEKYVIDPSARAFTSREQIEAHWRYFECDAVYSHSIDKRDADELVNFSDQLPDFDETDANLRRRVNRLRITVARQLERVGEYDRALALYEACNQAPARERCVRLLIAKGQWSKALELSQLMLNAPQNESERRAAQRLFARCSKQLAMPCDKPRCYRPLTAKIVLCDQSVRVEELARRFFSNNGECFHTENTLVNSVLGLFIWDIMFHPVPGVFFNPFQSAPADFHQPEFLQNRRELFETRMRELEDAPLFHARVLQAVEQHHGKQNPLVRWHGLSLKLLELALTRIPVAHWSAMFCRILSDTRENSNGFPDLVHFPHTGGYEFIEIKGPGDTLQAHQRRWMEYFDQHAIACRVVHVSYRVSDLDVSGAKLVSS